MKLIEVTSITELSNYNINNVVVAIGIFDGVHLGHQLLIKKLLHSANKYNATPIVLTFYPHPKEVLSLQHNSYQLMPQSKKVEMLGKFGVEAVVTIPFTIEFSRLSPEEFINKVLYAPNIKLSAICVGKKWKFGHKGTGNKDFLEKYSKEFNFQFEAVDEFSLTAGEKVSSSEIRRAVANGELELAQMMLGRDYSLFGQVEHGRNVASGVLNCPTANLTINSGIIPPNGVYSGYLKLKDKHYKTAIAIGVSPTFKHQYKQQRRVEAHLLEYDGENFYGDDVELIIKNYIREERTFNCAEDLKEQIRLDIEQISLLD